MLGNGDGQKHTQRDFIYRRTPYSVWVGLKTRGSSSVFSRVFVSVEEEEGEARDLFSFHSKKKERDPLDVI